MNTARIYSAQLNGLSAEIIMIEVDISNGLHSFSVVGLGDRAVEEAKDRVSAAIKNTGFTSPKQKNQKVIISLAPADIRKEGPSFDLAMAISYLSAAGEILYNRDNTIFLGELSLEGNIRRVSGVLPIACSMKSHGFTTAFIPKDNEKEASMAQDVTIYAVSTLREIVEHICGREILTPIKYYVHNSNQTNGSTHSRDMRFICGNEQAKRGMEIAAAGAHNIIMCGPPGTGKTMLAQSIVSILPDLSYEHSIEVTGIHSIAHVLVDNLITQPPFRSPHHTASYQAIIGGGTIPKPGEITLSHRGVLFLDEFPEFDRNVIEALRQPLEEHSITISRIRSTVTFPAQCILVASMNPCPCGLGKDRGCICPERIYQAYRRRLSGPIMDRIDIWVNVAKIDYDKLANRDLQGEDSYSIRSRIIKARAVQKKRFAKYSIPIDYNSEMSSQDIDKSVIFDTNAKETLKTFAEKLGISGRAFHRTIKIAQTIADLAGHSSIKKEAILEAFQYREKN